MRHEELLQRLYEPHVLAARQRFEADGGVRLVLDPTLEPALLERFLVQYCCLEARRAEPASEWLRGAGERCLGLGWEVLGQELLASAHHWSSEEAGWLEDMRRLLRAWNLHHLPRLEELTLLSQPPTAAFHEYTRLHEEVLAGPLPAGLAAVMLEFDGLGAVWAQPLLTQARRLLGSAALERLQFLAEHLERTRVRIPLHQRRLAEVLALLPQASQALAEAGAQALDIYTRLLQECLRAAAADLRPDTRPDSRHLA